MAVNIEYEAGEALGIDWKNIAVSVVEKALDMYHCPYEAQVNITFVSSDEIAEMNKEYRQIDGATDVLSFPMVDYVCPGDFSIIEDGEISDYFDSDTGELMLGDIVLCVDKIISQSEEYGHSRERELGFLTAHSMLHLFGFDHMKDCERKDMENRQEEILQQLQLTR